MVPLILLVLAHAAPSLGSSREYVFVNQRKTWFEAQAYCRDNFADLATMESQEDWARVREIEANYEHTYAWMGLYDDNRSWRWSIDNTSLYENGTPRLWGLSHYADNTLSSEHCGMLGGVIVHDHSCSSAFPSVCYNEPTNQYIPVRDPMNWETARRNCMEKYTDLASMRSQEETDEILSVVDGSLWWIGLFRDSWKWSDQSHSPFRAWAPAQPSGRDHLCGCTSAEGWHDGHCQGNYPFICSALVRRVLRVAMKTDGSTNLGDAAVQAGVLINLEKGLRDGGVQQNFNLTWRKHPNGKIFTRNVTQI